VSDVVYKELADGARRDEDLMHAYGAGDADAFDELYERHKGAVFRYFTRQLPAAEANDCFQNVWLKLINARERYQENAPFVNYLFTLAHNVLMDHFRSTRKLIATAPEEFEAMADGDDPVGGIDAVSRERLRERLMKLIAALPFHQREAWLLQQEAGMSHEAIANVTDATEEGVKSRLRYARQKLKTGLQAYAR
jgi:RNA polymerase sigma-70 factor (ECF subfamily)